MADERVPFKWGKWIKRNPDPFQRGVERGTPTPLIRGIKSRFKELRGPTKDELAEWEVQVKRMQDAGFVWNEGKKMWQRGEQFVKPWGFPEERQETPKQPEVDIASQAQEQGLEDMGDGYFQDTKGQLYRWDKEKQRFLKRL